MDQVLVRLDGMPEKILHNLLKKGIYKTKSEAIRAGLLALERRETMIYEWKQIQMAAQKNKRSFKEITQALDEIETL